MPRAVHAKGTRKPRVTGLIKLRPDQYRLVLMLRRGLSQVEIARKEEVWCFSIWGRIDTLAKHGVVSKGEPGLRNSNKVRVKLGTILLPGETPIKKAWKTDTVLSLAQVCYDTVDFDAAPVLADALQDAGCGGDAGAEQLLLTLRTPIPVVTAIPRCPGPPPEPPPHNPYDVDVWMAYHNRRDGWAIENRKYEDFFVRGTTDPRVAWRLAIERVLDRLLH